ncbi:uncharacterized protein PV09_06090 [Verruconis gallopava]|uniref:CST complex subunit Ten1 n=1 Tax=Verruconis gallopava TaxID=253628 RepID=A0A0D1YPV8_9PEZI|nr:uncharacterized protein PV09_06090 [Verruconis gallopava]KIW02652.1 hypothetical protein PV09_06090 [Verruconis gallopava]
MTSSVPTKLIFLTDLPSYSQGDKVRFMGCIDEYNAATGILTLKHDYMSKNHTAHVNVEHVREGLPSTAIAVGAWINIVGYIQGHQNSASIVQATMLWEAGPLKVADYERALQARKDNG